MALSDFRCILRFQVPFCYIDMLRHVNNVAYITWTETVRCMYFADVMKENLSSQQSMILARIELDYEQQLEYREQVAVGCRVSRLGRKSFDFSYEIWSESRQVRAAKGISPMVAYDYKTRSSILIPEHWRQHITDYEGIAPTAG